MPAGVSVDLDGCFYVRRNRNPHRRGTEHTGATDCECACVSPHTVDRHRRTECRLFNRRGSHAGRLWRDMLKEQGMTHATETRILVVKHLALARRELFGSQKQAVIEAACAVEAWLRGGDTDGHRSGRPQMLGDLLRRARESGQLDGGTYGALDQINVWRIRVAHPSQSSPHHELAAQLVDAAERFLTVQAGACTETEVDMVVRLRTDDALTIARALSRGTVDQQVPFELDRIRAHLDRTEQGRVIHTLVHPPREHHTLSEHQVRVLLLHGEFGQGHTDVGKRFIRARSLAVRTPPFRPAERIIWPSALGQGTRLAATLESLLLACEISKVTMPQTDPVRSPGDYEPVLAEIRRALYTKMRLRHIVLEFELDQVSEDDHEIVSFHCQNLWSQIADAARNTPYALSVVYHVRVTEQRGLPWLDPTWRANRRERRYVRSLVRLFNMPGQAAFGAAAPELESVPLREICTFLSENFGSYGVSQEDVRTIANQLWSRSGQGRFESLATSLERNVSAILARTS